jgi:hypothetical protein
MLLFIFPDIVEFFMKKDLTKIPLYGKIDLEGRKGGYYSLS